MSKLLKKSLAHKTLELQTGLIPIEDLGHGHLPYRAWNRPLALPGARIVTWTGVFSHVINVEAMDEDIAYHHPLHDDLEDVEMSDSLDHGQ